MRHLLFLFLVWAMAPHVTLLCAAEYPAKPIRLIVGYPPSGAADAVNRIIARQLSEAFGTTLVVDNRPGAEGALAPELVAKSAPDGYTLWVGGDELAGVAALRKNAPFDALKDFTPIALIGRYPFVLVAHASVPAKTLAELIEYARANPRKLNYATSTRSAILAMAQLTSLAKLEMVHVPYKGVALALPDLLTGRVHLGVFAASSVVPFVKDGALRALAILSTARSPLLPEVQTIAEAGVPRVSVVPWAGLFGPAKLPRTIVDRLAHEVNVMLLRPDVREQLARQGLEASGSTPAELTGFLKEQLEAWRTAAREAGLKSE
jgi:tripartite-type tricarboxylate transporter receptor subunit TctC